MHLAGVITTHSGAPLLCVIVIVVALTGTGSS